MARVSKKYVFFIFSIALFFTDCVSAHRTLIKNDKIFNEVNTYFDELRAVISTGTIVFVYPGDVSNFTTTQIRGRATILYNENVIEQIRQESESSAKKDPKCGYNCFKWIIQGFLAHEIAHIDDFPLFSAVSIGSEHELSSEIQAKELNADRLAGRALHLLGATKYQAQQYIERYEENKEEKRHPPKPYRLDAIRDGWEQVKRKEVEVYYAYSVSHIALEFCLEKEQQRKLKWHEKFVEAYSYFAVESLDRLKRGRGYSCNEMQKIVHDLGKDYYWLDSGIMQYNLPRDSAGQSAFRIPENIISLYSRLLYTNELKESDIEKLEVEWITTISNAMAYLNISYTLKEYFINLGRNALLAIKKTKKSSNRNVDIQEAFQRLSYLLDLSRSIWFDFAALAGEERVDVVHLD